MATLAAPTIVKRELKKGFIKATDINGITYRSVGGKAVGKGCFKDALTGKTFTPYTETLKTKEMLNANRNVAEFSNTYAKGLSDERKVVEFLGSKGFNIRAASKEENYSMDIDCWIGNIPVSIKSEFRGLKYGNIYFELENQLTTTGEWVKDGWYYTGKAEKYLILQGLELRLYDKQTVQQYVADNGWLRTRTLSWQLKATQGGSYRTMDTLSGYLDRDRVPYEASWMLA